MAASALRLDSVRANPTPPLADSNRDVTRPMPRVPAGLDSLAARSTVSALRRMLIAIEPWYDWGTINTYRLDAATEADAAEGDVRRFELQWLGLHIGCQFGRVPAKREH